MVSLQTTDDRGPMTEDRRWTTENRGQTAERSSDPFSQGGAERFVTFLLSADAVEFTQFFNFNGDIIH